VKKCLLGVPSRRFFLPLDSGESLPAECPSGVFEAFTKESIMMRRFMSGLGKVWSNAGHAFNRSALQGVFGLLAVGGALGLAAAEKEPAATRGNKLTSKAPAAHTASQPESAAIPESLMKLKLSPEQQDQIKEIIQNYDQSLGMVWNQFGQRYMQAITMESTLLAAIEDNLTEDQRQQVRDQRHKTAQHEQAMAATNTKLNQAEVAKNEETNKPANAAEEGLEAISVSLTDEQEAAADKVQEKYRAQLRSLNRDIQGLHIRLVSLEADKLVEIEKVLTKEQLSQLRKNRQNAPATPKVAVNKAEPTKTE
jgi:hypothetical protein